MVATRDSTNAVGTTGCSAAAFRGNHRVVASSGTNVATSKRGGGEEVSEGLEGSEAGVAFRVLGTIRGTRNIVGGMARIHHLP